MCSVPDRATSIWQSVIKNALCMGETNKQAETSEGFAGESSQVLCFAVVQEVRQLLNAAIVLL